MESRRSSGFVIISIVTCGSFHFGNVVSEIEHYLNGQFSGVLIVEVIDILLNLEAVVRDGLTTLTKRLFHARQNASPGSFSPEYVSPEYVSPDPARQFAS